MLRIEFSKTFNITLLHVINYVQYQVNMERMSSIFSLKYSFSSCIIRIINNLSDVAPPYIFSRKYKILNTWYGFPHFKKDIGKREGMILSLNKWLSYVRVIVKRYRIKLQAYRINSYWHYKHSYAFLSHNCRRLILKTIFHSKTRLFEVPTKRNEKKYQGTLGY